MVPVMEPLYAKGIRHKCPQISLSATAIYKLKCLLKCLCFIGFSGLSNAIYNVHVFSDIKNIVFKNEEWVGSDLAVEVPKTNSFTLHKPDNYKN